MTRLDASAIPFDFPVVPVTPTHPGRVYAVATCGECGLSWDDTIPTTYTPAPSARCPFEAFHEMDEPESEEVDEPISTWFTITREYNGAPDGPKFIVRRHAVHYEGGHDTQEDAWAWVAEQNGRVAK